jgi:hypothetical protein
MRMSVRRGTCARRRPLAIAGILGVFASAASVAESGHEFLFFPSVDGFYTFSESDSSVEESKTNAALDLLYGYSGDRFRFLGEFLWSTHETDFERLQAGVRISDNASVWGGRFHSPAKFWTSEYHHGQYLQTSITRPALEEWEDDGGTTPAHITGLLLESEYLRSDESALVVAASFGYAPVFEDGALETHELFKSASDHGVSLNLRVAYRPESVSMTQFGLLAGWNEINVVPTAVPLPDEPSSIDQAMLGAFGDWYWDRLRLLASVVYYDTTLELPAQDADDSYLLGYAQLEYEANNVVTVFGRIEGGIDQDDSPYLALFDAVITERYMLGARWDVAEHHALTVELANTTFGAGLLGSRDYNEFRLQWSAVYP